MAAPRWPVAVYRHGDPAKHDDGLPVREYRGLEPVLNEHTVAAQAALAAKQASYLEAMQQQERVLDQAFLQQDLALNWALTAHRPGFERPAAALALHEKRTEAREEKYQQWQEEQIRYQQELRRFRKQYCGPPQGLSEVGERALSKREKQEKKQATLEEMKQRCDALRDEVLADAAQEEEHYGDHLQVPPEDMHKKQLLMFKELTDKRAEAAAEAAKQRALGHETRLRGIHQMQQQQRHLRDQVNLERGHERLRLVKVVERSKEQHRALSLGTPQWLLPRPFSG